MVTIALILAAYRQGYFPMASGKKGEIGFYFYEPRGIIPLDDRFIIRKSLRVAVEQSTTEIRIDTAFDEVINQCARYDELPDDEIWISEEMKLLYSELHRMGIAHSVEIWNEGALVGGLYGLTFGAAFCGESMFSKESNASQIALIALVEHLRKTGFTLLDSQMESEHLKQFGLYTVSQTEYLGMLSDAIELQVDWNTIIS